MRNAMRVQARFDRRGFTLIEVLIATLITLILVGSLAVLFGNVSKNVSDARAATALQDNIRHVKDTLIHDLRGVTAPTTPPLEPGCEHGYFEGIEGPIGPVYYPIVMTNDPVNSFPLNLPTLPSVLASTTLEDDTTIADNDDVLMFTARSNDQPFVGTGFPDNNYISPVAEVMWFLRGSTLYRRVLILRNYAGTTATYANLPVSLRISGPRNSNAQMMPFIFDDLAIPPSVRVFFLAFGNTLGDLTMRENRFAHQQLAFPHDSRYFTRTTPVGTLNPDSPLGVNSSAYVARPGFMLPVFGETVAGWPMPAFYARFYPEKQKGWPGSGVRPPLYSGIPDALAAVSNIGNRDANSQGIYLRPSGGTPVDKGQGVYHRTRPWRAYDPWSARPLGIKAVNDDSKNITDADTHFNGLTKANEFEYLTDGRTVGKRNSVSSLSTELIRNHGGAPRFDDVVMTNVLSFDVKYWDPGAPIFTIDSKTPSSDFVPISSPGVTVMPHDPAYKAILKRFISGEGNMAPSGFGAYVDLNYMWGASRFSKLRAPKNSSGTVSDLGYLDRLELYERDVLKLPPYTLPRPAFAGPGVSPGDDATHWRELDISSTVKRPVQYCANLVGATHEISTASNIQFMLNDRGGTGLSSVYCTWSTHYEYNGIDDDRDGIIDNYTNGLDDAGSDPGVDDPSERETSPPYPAALRGIQVKIRAFEPDSRQIREVTVVQEFLAE